MVNSKDFIDRLKKVMEHEQLSASTFADKVGVQRSSISHILSGRNKPSLDFVLKITTEFSNVDIKWLLNGSGNYPNIIENVNTSTPTLFNSNLENSEKKIQRIVVFYTDGTFDEYNK